MEPAFSTEILEMTQAQQIHLVRRPEGMPQPGDFALTEVALAEPGEGEVEVEALLISVDPYMRPRFDRDQALDAVMPGGGIGRVTRSRDGTLREGTLVKHGGGFQTRFVAPAATLSPLDPDPALPLSAYLHVLGGTGLTAWGGLLHTGALAAGDRVLVSTAGGAVGSVAAQIARIKGNPVAGMTGSDAKAAWLRDVAGIAAINYRSGDLGQAIATALPEGVDVYFENVGGSQLDAVLPQMRLRGRIPVCGMIGAYNGDGPGVRNLTQLIYKRIRMEGFVMTDFVPLQAEFEREMSGWIKSGQMHWQETIIEGFGRIPEALIGLFKGENAGKMLVRAAD